MFGESCSKVRTPNANALQIEPCCFRSFVSRVALTGPTSPPSALRKRTFVARERRKKKTSSCNKSTTMNVITCLALAFAMVSWGSTSTMVKPNVSGMPHDFQYSRIGLTISSMVNSTAIRQIKIYWSNLNPQKDDYLAIYEGEPMPKNKPLYRAKLESTSGIKVTELQAEPISSANLTFVEMCLKYHVAWLRNDTVMLKNCLRTRPTWMADRKDILGDKMMREVFLPGTHNSGAYALYPQPRKPDLIDKYSVTQDIDVLSQLIFGARYLDLRIGYYTLSAEKWWVNHGILRMTPLSTVLSQLKLFLESTKEIVILDIQEFPFGFGDGLSVHRKFIALLEQQLASYMLPKSATWAVKLNNVWSSGKRLIVGYDHSQAVIEHDNIWPCVVQQWGNVRTRTKLYWFLNEKEDISALTSTSRPRAAMAELTANTLDVFLDRLGGIRQMAEEVNSDITEWYNTIWACTANIVAVDFLLSTGIVETAIQWNERRNANCTKL
ncbi:hypothetical protein KM043_014049 [Ampulex compressa]|nr:hypothetical protein KM043_014049 [Ampulex compressa]